MKAVPTLSPFGEKLNNLLNHVTENRFQSLKISSIAGAARSLLTAELAKREKAPLLLIADTYESAELVRQNLCFFLPEEEINFFPNWDTLPYDNQSPDKAVLATRFKTMANILSGEAPVIITTSSALQQYILPPELFLKNCVVLQQGVSYERETLLKSLVGMGFVRVDMVEEKGEFSVRGEIIDIYPVTESSPIRLDFFDDELETLKPFDVETQTSTGSSESLVFYPCSEVLFSDETKARALETLISLRANTVPQQYHYIVEQIQNGVAYSGIESLLPIFYPHQSTLLSYFPDKPKLLFIEKESVDRQVKNFFDEVKLEFEYSVQEGNPTLDPDQLFNNDNGFANLTSQYQYMDLQPLNLEGSPEFADLSTADNSAIRSLSLDTSRGQQSPIQNVLNQLKSWHQAGAKIIIAAGSFSKGERIQQMLEELGLTIPITEDFDHLKRGQFFLQLHGENESSFQIVPTVINGGFRWIDHQGESKVILISEEEIFGQRQKKRTVKSSQLKHFFSSLGELKVGDYVVHVEYGIGQYEGLKKINAGDFESDYLVICYQGGDKVYVPVDKFHLVQNYAGGEGASKAKINKLGDRVWSKTKSKVRTEIDDIADELVRIYAEREARKGISFSADGGEMNEFSMSFPYQETEDQERAISDVTVDMESPKPMDRLVCGDVGFGKTEVAMRATYKAVLDGAQVGILVPTTILAQQHFENFKKRFQGTPVTIGIVSRFQTPKQIRETKQALKENQVDVLIGTHRLLSKDIIFKNLGLLVVDEEQRFGVKHKESIKKIRTTIDNLTLTATPIPRTLHMSLVGIRDISVINTAPMDRRAIRTRLVKFSDYVITEAANREIRRGGQIYFIHNRVESIYQVGDYLNQLLPKVKIAVAHGQMSERDLEKVMMDFIKGDFDILLATTIVESGLDIPNVNTIMVNNSDQFGLSQLYQLRGRVGRSKVQAYAYLLTPRDKVLTDIARKRLTILQELNHLGAGFKIASHDLELRGAGNILGSKQSGHITAVGFELYTSMIEEAVNKIKLGDSAKSQNSEEVKLSLNFEANLPDSYIGSMNQRLDAYKSISSCKSEEELWSVRTSLEDRFGKLPENTVSLFHSMQIKLLVSEMSISQLNQGGGTLEMIFSEQFKPDQNLLLKFLNDETYKPKLTSSNGIEVRLDGTSADQILRFIKHFNREVLQTSETPDNN